MGPKAYLKITGTGLVPVTWFSVDAGSAAAEAGLGGLDAGTGIVDQLKAIAGVDAVTEVGSESVNGVTATHYRASLDPAELTSALSALSALGGVAGASAGSELGTASIPVDLRVDGAGHLVRVREEFSVTLEGTASPESLQLDLTDFGVPVTAVAPKDAVDLTGLLGLLGGT